MIQKYFSKHNCVRALVVLITIGFSTNDAFAAGPPKVSDLSNPLAQVLLVIIVGLLLAIGLLANVILGAAQVYLQRFKDERKKSGTTAAKALMVVMICLTSVSLFAAATPADPAATAVVETTIAGLSFTSFYVLLGVIGLELLIMIVLLINLKKLLTKESLVMAEAAIADNEPIVVRESAFIKWWDKVNSFKPIQEESTIDLGHNYDGIRELDNRLPPWWLYGFYLCIIFAGVYLYRYHVAHSAPLSAEELSISLEKAAIDKEEYLKKSANNVDENTVTYLSSPADHEAAQKIFSTICAACHLPDGGGGIGVMNIMLVSVTERTHEIGIRMAVGARQEDIMQQFLIESVLVCLIGGTIGIILSYGVGLIFSLFVSSFAMKFSVISIISAFLCSTIIGVVFGFIPARNAARLDPIEALARE